MLRRLPLLLLLLALPALAGPPKRPKKAPKRPVKADATLNATQRKDFRAAIADGRARQKGEDYLGALAAFSRALRIFPDDPRALQEHGWAAFKAGNLELAERSTRAAIARTVDAKLLGAAWYNMGRILEAQAISAYKRSLAVRVNATVRERLARLDPDAAAAADATLIGPLADLATVCSKLHTDRAGERVLCDPSGEKVSDLTGPKTADAGGAFREVRLFATDIPLVQEDETVGVGESPGEIFYHLALRTDGGWYVLPEVSYAYNPGAFGIFESVEINKLAVVPFGASGPAVQLLATKSRTDSDMGLNEVSDEGNTSLTLCAIGKSGKPSCHGPMIIKSHDDRTLIDPDGDPEPGMAHDLYSRQAEVEAIVHPDGTLELKGDAKKAPPEVKDRLGRLPLAFP